MISKGFTLIELMIAVAIIGIIATIAVPQYTDYITQSRRTDGMSALLHMAALQERYYVQNNTYAAQADIDQVGGSSSKEGYYSIEIDSASGSAFSITATAIGEQAGDTDCPTLSINQAGAKTPVACW